MTMKIMLIMMAIMMILILSDKRSFGLYSLHITRLHIAKLNRLKAIL